MLNIKKKLKEHTTIKNSFLVLISNGFSQFASLIVAVIISRTLSVSQYGIYALLNSISSFVTDMADMGMNSSITKFIALYYATKDKLREDLVIRLALQRKIKNTIIVLTIAVLFSKVIAKYMLHDSSLYYFMFFVALSSGISLLTGAMIAIIQGRQQYKYYSLVVIAWNATWLIVICIFYVFDYITVMSSVFAGIFSGIVNIFICFKFTNIKLGILKSDILKTNVELTKEVRGQFSKFGNWMLLWSLFALLQSRMDVFLLSLLTTTEQVSYFDVANKMTKPVIMVISAYSQVLVPVFASINEKGKVRQEIAKIIKFIAFITAVIVGAIIFMKPIIILLFGHKFDSAILPARILLIAIIFFAWSIPFNNALYAVNKPHIFALAALAGLIVTVVGDFFVLQRLGSVGASLTYVGAQFIGLVVAVVAYRKYVVN